MLLVQAGIPFGCCCDLYDFKFNPQDHEEAQVAWNVLT